MGSSIVVLQKGDADIFYDQYEGDIIVYYYLLCETDDNVHVTRTCVFAYSCGQTYFDMNTSITKNIKTLDEAKKLDIAVYPPSLDQECRLANLMEMDSDFYVEWLKFKKKFFFYERDDED